MTDSKTHERNLCRVFISAADLAKEGGLPLPHGAEIVRIMPSCEHFDIEQSFDHVMFLRHESLPEVPRGQMIPVRKIIVEVRERDMGCYTRLIQKEARFE